MCCLQNTRARSKSSIPTKMQPNSSPDQALARAWEIAEIVLRSRRMALAGRHEEAMMELLCATHLPGETAWDSAMATVLRLAGREAEAAAVLRRLIRSGGGQTGDYFDLAEILDSQGHGQEALDLLRQGEDSQGNDTAYQMALLRLVCLFGTRKEAMQRLRALRCRADFVELFLQADEDFLPVWNSRPESEDYRRILGTSSVDTPPAACRPTSR